MSRAEIVARVLNEYPADCHPLGWECGRLAMPATVRGVGFPGGAQTPVRLECLGSAGGFSGACFWRLEAHRGPLCLRQWPADHPTPERLAWIHAVLRHAHQHGFQAVPVPALTHGGNSFVARAGTLWELTPWLPGTADYLRAPSREKLRAAVTALARFHQAVRSFPADRPGRARSPGIDARRCQLRRLIAGGAERLTASVRPEVWPAFADRAQQLLALFPRLAPPVFRQLDAAAPLTVQLQPCLRDVWSDHILFSGNQVSGIIDFGALAMESVAADLSRLLGSMAGSDAAAWQAGLAGYELVRPLTDAERTLVTAFDRSSLLMSGLNWIEWIYVEQRQFENPRAIVDRLDRLLVRLQQLG